MSAREWVASVHLGRIAAWACRRFEVSRDELPDLFQELALRLLSVPAGRMLNAAFVFRAAESAASDMLRRRGRLKRRSVAQWRPKATADPELRGLLLARVSSLPRKLRAFYALRFMAGFGEREVAKLLGVSRGAVRNMEVFLMRLLVRGAFQKPNLRPVSGASGRPKTACPRT